MTLGRLRWHYLPIAAAWFVFATLPPLGVSVHSRDVVFDLLIGLSLVVAGIGDHRMLCRTFVAAAEELYGRRV
jgi:hypothetical protein